VSLCDCTYRLKPEKGPPKDQQSPDENKCEAPNFRTRDVTADHVLKKDETEPAEMTGSTLIILNPPRIASAPSENGRTLNCSRAIVLSAPRPHWRSRTDGATRVKEGFEKIVAAGGVAQLTKW